MIINHKQKKENIIKFYPKLIYLGLIPGPKSFLKDYKNTFISAVGVSFYSACVPPQSYDLGFAATCLHWLREKPCNLRNSIHHTLSDNAQEKELFAKQAAKDWEEILVKRSEEMKTGTHSLSYTVP